MRFIVVILGWDMERIRVYAEAVTDGAHKLQFALSLAVVALDARLDANSILDVRLHFFFRCRVLMSFLRRVTSSMLATAF